MKTLLKSKNLPLLALVLGAVGFVLRMGLYLTALDGKNLLLRWHPLEILLWLVTAAAFALMFLGTRKTCQAEPRPSVPAALGAAAMAVGIGVSVFLTGSGLEGTLGLVWKITGGLSVIAMVLVAVARWQGKAPFFLLHGITCIFFALHMVGCYQGWSSNPQIQDYVFTLFSSVGLLLFSYQQTALDADTGSIRLQRLFGLVTVFCCLVALSGTKYPLLYLTGSIWALTNTLGE